MDDMGDCLMEILNKQLQSMLLVTAGAKNLAELAAPLFKHKWKTCFKKPAKKSKAKIQPSNSVRIEYTQQMQTLLDREMDIEPHGKPQLCFDGSIEEYTEIAVTFGFLVLWGVTWPLAGLLTWLCLLFELYVDQFKILNLVRRPFPKKVIGFGFREELFSNMLYVAVFMNALMLVMTAKINFVGEFICESALGKGKCPRPQDSADHPGSLYFISEAISFLVYFIGLLVLLHLCRHVLPRSSARCGPLRAASSTLSRGSASPRSGASCTRSRSFATSASPHPSPKAFHISRLTIQRAKPPAAPTPGGLHLPARFGLGESTVQQLFSSHGSRDFSLLLFRNSSHLLKIFDLWTSSFPFNFLSFLTFLPRALFLGALRRRYNIAYFPSLFHYEQLFVQAS